LTLLPLAMIIVFLRMWVRIAWLKVMLLRLHLHPLPGID
jgi:hypothetical protein